MTATSRKASEHDRPLSHALVRELYGRPSLPEDPSPQFDERVGHLPQPCTPRDLYCRLQNVEENPHYLEPAFRFVQEALRSPALASWMAQTSSGTPTEFVEGLLRRARAELRAPPAEGCAASWPARVAREFAPLGLIDGVWLQGLVQFHMVESPLGMAALAQLMHRFAGPGVGEPYAQRYAALLRSLGVVPASIGRWEPDSDAPCDALSYEHALLGLCLSLFPSALEAETVGFNLWMAAIGPCPLLQRLAGELGPQACVSYLDKAEQGAVAELAKAGALAHLASDEEGEGERRARIALGFAAAQRSYERWEQGMLGRNVPRTPREAVLEMIAAKARFATGHHVGVHIPGRAREEGDLESLFAGGRAGHEALLDRLAASPMIRPGAPDKSPFITRSIAFGGPMFDVFTPSETADLREWVARLGTEQRRPREEPVALEGLYTAPQDPDSLRAHALEHYGDLPAPELLYRLLNADRYPAVRAFGKIIATNALAVLADTLADDPRLESAQPPPYSERLVAEVVAENHARNVQTRSDNERGPQDGEPATGFATEVADILVPVLAGYGAPLDGFWLGGFCDVQRIHHEEYGWLFRIYASESGDGQLQRNHNFILRQMQKERGMAPAQAMLSLRDRRLYDAVVVTFAEIIMISMALNTRHFLPELLGMNLFIEAKGVGGYYLTTMKGAEKMGRKWTALSMRLHNSIDNYASGHTGWSVAAVQAFMARVEDAAPQAAAEQWHRIWRMWRFNELRDYGTDAQRQALEERLGEVATASFVPSEV
jgi:hypothetical protein